MYILHIQYKKPRKINGWGGKYDEIRFDSKGELLNYINGENAYDYLDNCIHSSDNEILLYAEDEKGRVVWDKYMVKTMKKDTEKKEDSNISKIHEGVIGSIHEGVKNLPDIFKFMGDNPGYAIAIVNKEEYVLKHLPEDSTLVGSMESWKKQYVKVLQGNSNINKCKIIELIEKFPRNTIAVEDYLNDNDLQVIVDWLLSNGMYLRLCKPTKCFEFYCEYYL